jgi:calpain, invertebrate
MSYENEPKTIEDYKDVVKILKLKIIKQNKKIQELELKNKNYEEQINSVTLKGDDFQISSRAMLELENDVKNNKEQKELELNTLKGKVGVVKIYVGGLKKLGITPEAVFRIADFAYKNYVESDYFREILAKMKLGLTQKEISTLIFIFDESYSGFITREDYTNSLNAYKMGIEESYHQYIHECVFKLSQMMHYDKINLIKFYEEMESRAKGKIGTTNKKMVDLNVFEEQIKKCYAGKVGER